MQRLQMPLGYPVQAAEIETSKTKVDFSLLDEVIEFSSKVRRGEVMHPLDEAIWEDEMKRLEASPYADDRELAAQERRNKGNGMPPCKRCGGYH